MTKWRRCALAALTSAGLMGCFPKAAPPPKLLDPKQVELAKAKDPAVSEEALERGRVLFVDKCGACHDHPDLAPIRLSKWPAILKDMIEKSELEKDPAQSADLTTFVLTAAQAAGAPP